MKFKIIDISSLEGLRQAEKLKKEGWNIEQIGLFSIMFSKGKSGKY